MDMDRVKQEPKIKLVFDRVLPPGSVGTMVEVLCNNTSRLRATEELWSLNYPQILIYEEHEIGGQAVQCVFGCKIIYPCIVSDLDSAKSHINYIVHFITNSEHKTFFLFHSLYQAVRADSLVVVRFILELGVSPNGCFETDTSILLYLAMMVSSNMVRLLLDYGLRWDGSDWHRWGVSPLEAALRRGMPADIVETLIELGLYTHEDVVYVNNFMMANTTSGTAQGQERLKCYRRAQELLNKPSSLQTSAMRVVAQILGPLPGRREKTQDTGLPSLLQQDLTKSDNLSCTNKETLTETFGF